MLGVGGGIAGLWISRAFDVAAGGSVGLTMTLIFILAYAGRRIAARVRRSRSSATSSREAAADSLHETPRTA